jgi:hypothetical protein
LGLRGIRWQGSGENFKTRSLPPIVRVIK